MKRYASSLILGILILIPLFSHAQEEFEITEGDTTFIMKKYYLVLLKKGPNRDGADSLEVARVQQAHLDNINRLAAEGKLAIAGPMGDDGDLRGIFIMTVADLDEAERLVNTDPAIKVGRLTAEIHPWWAAKGSRLP